MEYLVPQSAPEYSDTAQFVQKARSASIPPEGAFLLNNNTICGFTPLFRDEVVVKSHRRDGDRSFSPYVPMKPQTAIHYRLAQEVLCLSMLKISSA